MRVRFWERGVGYTRASGTGAASAAVAAVLSGRTRRQVTVACDGGELEVEWPEGGDVRQVGEVEVVFEGGWIGPARSGHERWRTGCERSSCAAPRRASPS